MGDLLTSRAQALQVTTSSFFFFTKKNLLLFFLYSLMCVSSPRVTRPSLKLLSETMIRRLQIMQNGFLLSSKSYILMGLWPFGFTKPIFPLGFCVLVFYRAKRRRLDHLSRLVQSVINLVVGSLASVSVLFVCMRSQILGAVVQDQEA